MTDRQSMDVRITATDDASDDLQRVGRAAQQMGRDVDRGSQQAERGFRGVGDAARRLEDNLDKIGAGIGVVTGAIALLGRNALDHERQVEGLRRAYGDASDEILAFTEAIQDSTNFSNDAARQAALTGASLVTNYDLSAESVQRLIEVSADLATVHGVTLPDAMSRVAGAIRGEGEAAELLGLNLSDSAVAARAAAAGLTGWNTTMTESEKAAFRLSLVLEDTARFTGAAADAAEGAAGRGADFRDFLDDTAESAGRALGPLGEFLAISGDLALAMPLAGAAVGRLATGLTTLVGVLGPAGIAAAALTAGAAFLVLRDNQEDTKEVTTELDDATGDLIDTLNRLAETQGVFSEQFLAVADWERQVANMEALNVSLEELEGRAERAARAEALRAKELAEANGQTLTAGEVNDIYLRALERNLDVLRRWNVDAEEGARIQQLLISTLQYQGAAWDAVSAHVDEAFEDFERGRIDVDGLIRRLDLIPEVALAATQAEQELARTTREMSSAYYDAVRAFDGVAPGLAGIAREGLRAVVAEVEQTKAVDDLTAAYERAIGILSAMAVLHESHANAARLGYEAMLANQQAALDFAIAQTAPIVPLEEAAAAMGSLRYASFAAVDGVVTLREQAILLAVQEGEVAAATNALGGEISTVNNALRDMEEARDILLERQAQGIALSEEEIAFLNEYDRRVATATQSVEDWEVQQGILAGRQLDLIESQEALNETMGESNEAMGEVADQLERLVDSLVELFGLGTPDLAPPPGTAELWRDVESAARGAYDALNGPRGQLPEAGVFAPTSGYTVVEEDGRFVSRPYAGGTARPGSPQSTLPPAPANVAPPPQTLLVPVAMDTAAAEADLRAFVAAMDSYLDVFAGEERTVEIVGDGTELTAVVRDAEGEVDALVFEKYVVNLSGDNTEAVEAIRTAATLANQFDGTTVSARILADASRYYDVVNAIDGSLAGTAYIRLVGVGGAGFTDVVRREGGAVSAAYGRLVTMGEAGPEWVDTPGGGGFLAAQHGTYFVPQGGYVHPAPATRAMGVGGTTINIGPIYARTRSDGQAIARAVRDELRGLALSGARR